ncbi:hypothetical protein [Secundilactobacillus kimchicus]|uniref:hypothetical protein n=1 Tax=Secundilactobacillus kimchicus TaxID=528209 RepID=UPI0024A88FAD|nr:hypothetical protein [Secundilactobacillus kimchicus]
MNSDQLKALTKLDSVVQDLPVGTISVQDDHTVNVPIKVANQDVTKDYLLHGLALFAKPANGDEILYGILTASQPDLIPAQTGTTVTGTNFKLKVHVGDAENVNIVISLNDSVSNDELIGILKNYVLGTNLDERFKNYYTKKEVDTTIGQLSSQTISDTRDVDWTPKRYMDNGVKVTRESKSNTTLNFGDTGFSELITDTPWGNSSGIFPFQIAKDTGTSKFFFRIGKADEM